MKKHFNSLLLTLNCVLISFTATAQQEHPFISVHTTETTSEIEEEQINTLMYDLQPTSFVHGSQIFGEEIPTKVEVHMQDVETLYQENNKFKSAELLLVKITERNNLLGKLDLSKLSGFDSLKFVIVQCQIECDASEVRKLIPALDDFKVFYLVSIPR